MSSQLTLSSMLSRISPSPSPGSPELPVLQRSPRSSQSQSRSQSQGQSQSWSQSRTQPTLPKTIAYVFSYSLFKRTLLSTDPPLVQYTYMQLSYNYSIKFVGTQLASTSNLIKHLKKHNVYISLSFVLALAS